MSNQRSKSTGLSSVPTVGSTGPVAAPAIDLADGLDTVRLDSMIQS